MNDELRAWTPDRELTHERAKDLALEPLERIWSDPDGIIWKIRVELPSSWRRGGESGGPFQLAFCCGSLLRVTSIPAETYLGELTNLELIELFRATL